MKRNGIISFWKFLFAVMIVLFHGKRFSNGNDFVLFNGGYIGVEFFFIVSGVFLAASILKNWDKDTSNLGCETLTFIFKKFCSFFPYMIIAYFLLLGTYILTDAIPVYKMSSSIWELFLLQKVGLNYYPVNAPSWYLSSMLMCMFLIYPLMRKFKMNYIYFIAPISIVFCLGLMGNNIKGFNHVADWIGFTNFGNIRAFAELNIGVLIYFISNKLKQINFTKLGKFVLTIIEITCLFLPFFITNFIKSSYRYDYVMLLMISIGICIAVSNITLEKDILNNNTVYYFEKLSLPLYLFHFVILKIIQAILSLFSLSFSYPTKLSLYLGVSLVFSMIILKIVESLRSKNFYIDKVKRLFISE
ncbi:MAG: acyltransferase [Firmicutes bacterium]|nr:acyltransferase [Bacillota bacterium]